jgi:hypothetical protein
MLGAIETSSGPDVAPVGIVNVIDVALQELVVTAVPFSNTALPPCVAPKLAPVIVTWLPTDPVVAETLVITGAGAAVELTDTLSNVAVSRVLLPLLETANPMYTFDAMVIVALVPACVQSKPFFEIYPVNVLLLRVNFTQYDANEEKLVYGQFVLPPVVARLQKTAFEFCKKTNAFAAF